MLALIFEALLLSASLTIYTNPHREPKASNPDGGQMEQGVTKWEAMELVFDVIRIISLLALVFFYAVFVILRFAKLRHERGEENGGPREETSCLLNGHRVENRTVNGQDYGSIRQKETSGWVRPDKVPSKSWWEYIRGYSLFFPYLWPSRSLRLQITVVICFVLVMMACVVNLLVPYQVSVITNILSEERGGKLVVPWGQISLYILYRLLQGNNGLLSAIRGTLWVPISQYSYQELSTASFEHVHGLSLEFHLGKKTGEVLSALSKGNSINTFLEQVTFQVFPMLVDLAVAIGYFLIAFDAYYALIVAIVTFAYLYITVRLAQWRAEIRREMVNYSRQEDAVK